MPWTPTDKAQNICNGLPEEMRGPFLALCEEYQSATEFVLGRKLYNPQVLAELVQWGWRKEK